MKATAGITCISRHGFISDSHGFVRGKMCPAILIEHFEEVSNMIEGKPVDVVYMEHLTRCPAGPRDYVMWDPLNLTLVGCI